MEVRKVKSKTILKHALSWALTLAIVLAMLPAVTLPVKAAEVDDPNAAITQDGINPSDQPTPTPSVPGEGGLIPNGLKDFTPQSPTMKYLTAHGKNIVTSQLDFVTMFTTDVDKLAEEGWAWEKSTNTLTLDGLDLEVEDAVNALVLPTIATIKIINGSTNTISCSPASGRVYTILSNGDLTITGDGILNLNAITGAELSTMTRVASIKILGSVTVNASATSTGNATYGMRTYGGDLTIGGGAVLNVEALSSANSYGIYANGNINITDGTLIAKGQTVAAYMSGTLIMPADYEIKGNDGSGNYTVDGKFANNKLLDSSSNAVLKDLIVAKISNDAGDPNRAIIQGGAKMDAPNGGYSMFKSPIIPVEIGKTYDLSAWIIGTGSVCLTALKDPADLSNVTYVNKNADPATWTQTGLQFTAATDTLQIALENDTGDPGKRYIYGVSLKEAGTSVELLTFKGDYSSWTGDATYSYLTTALFNAEFIHNPVSNIIGVPGFTAIGVLTLNGAVYPTNATNQNIIWSIKDAGTTGATLSGNTLTTTDEGTVVLTATVALGASKTRDYIKDFSIVVKDTTLRKPVIVHAPYSLKAGDVGSLFGGGFGQLADIAMIKIAILPLTNLSGAFAPDNSAAVIATPFNVDDSLVQFTIPDDIKNDLWAVWACNPNGVWSNPVFINKADVYWVSERMVYPGQKITLGGRNLVNPSDRSANGATVTFVPVGGGASQTAKIDDITDYTVQLEVPAGLVAGTKYDVTYTNGAGDAYGVVYTDNVTRERVTAMAKNAAITYFDDNFNANVAWLSGVKTDFTADVTAFGATGDGTTDDTAAIKSAISAINSNGGGILYFPQGTYLISSGIGIGNNTVITGDGPDKSVIKWDGASGTMISLGGIANGVFGVKLISDKMRPNDGSGTYVMNGLVLGIGVYNPFYTAYGSILKNVDISLADGGGVTTYTSGSFVVENCNISVSHGAVSCQPSGRVRYRNNTFENMVRATVCFGSAEGSGLDCGQSYIENNRIIGNSVNRRAIDDDPTLNDNNKSWIEVLLDMTEHRPCDFSNCADMLFVGNSIEGVYGDPCSNAGEGVISQAIAGNNWVGYVKSVGLNSLSTGDPSKLKGIIPNYYYVTIIAGPGIGQMRTVVGLSGDELFLDRPWDIFPTTESIYSVDSVNMNKAIWCNNNYSAASNKASFGLWCKSYDMTISNNFITGGAGIWYVTGISGTTQWNFHHYFLTIENNYLNGWGNPWFLTEKSTVIGPCSDGGSYAGDNPSYPASALYGLSIEDNTIVGKTNNPQMSDLVANINSIPQYLIDAAKAAGQELPYQFGRKPWWAYNYVTGLYDTTEQIAHFNRFALRSGLFVATDPQYGTVYPNVVGEIVDGNSVSNTIYGVCMSAMAFNTVLRNNNFIGNKYNQYETDLGTRTTVLDTNRPFGYSPLAPIDKTALDKPAPTAETVLVNAIAAAIADVYSVVVSVDGLDIPQGQTWVTEDALDNYMKAVHIAYSVLTNSNATQSDMSTAVTALATAKTAFIKYDITAPVISITGVEDNGLYNKPVTPTVSATDVNLDSTNITLNGQPYTGNAIDIDGSYTLKVTAIDKAGNKSESSIGFTVDQTPPEITVNGVKDGDVVKLNQDVAVTWSCSDKTSGIDTSIGDLPSDAKLDTSKVGPHTLTFTATDKAGNKKVISITYYVHYDYSEVLNPMNNDGSDIFSLGRTIPVKFQLKDAKGTYITDAVAKLYIAEITGDKAGMEFDAVSTSSDSNDNSARYDSAENQYIFNLNTKDLKAGVYQIRIELGDGTTNTVKINLK